MAAARASTDSRWRLLAFHCIAMSVCAAASDEPVTGGSSGSGTAGSAAEPLASGVVAKVDKVLAESSGGLTKQIENLKKAQQEARKARQQLSRDLRNAQRRKRRLKAKSRMLSVDDLVDVLMMRKEATTAPPEAAKLEPFAVPNCVEGAGGDDDDDDGDDAPPEPKAAKIGE